MILRISLQKKSIEDTQYRIPIINFVNVKIITTKIEDGGEEKNVEVNTLINIV